MRVKSMAKVKSWFSLDEVAEALGVAKRAVWETMLCYPEFVQPLVAVDGHLAFSRRDRRRLGFIKSARTRGFTEPEIRERLTAAASPAVA